MSLLFQFLSAGELYINIFWWLTIALMIIHYIACAHAPDSIIGRILPLHHAFRLEKNIDLNYQSLGYALVHTKWFSNFTHLTLITDAFAWFAIFFYWHWSVAAIVAAVIIFQTLLYREWTFAVIMFIMWTLIISIAFKLTTDNSNTLFYTATQFYLLAAGVMRFVGHVPEPLPPFILNEDDKFTALNRKNFNLKIVFMIPIGFVAEFASGLPTRLFPVQVYFVSQWLSILKPNRFMDWQKIAFTARQIHRLGFRSVPETAALYEVVLNKKSVR